MVINEGNINPPAKLEETYFNYKTRVKELKEVVSDTSHNDNEMKIN